MTESTSFRLRPQEEAGEPGKLQELLASEKVSWPIHLKPVQWTPTSDAPIDAARYTSQAFHDLEAGRLWPRVWQLACREEQVLNVGDCFVYEITGRSVLVVRGHDQKLRAFYNACLHRGRQLRNQSGCANELRCPFHGFTWSLEGEFSSVPCSWDFRHLENRDMRLPELRCEVWNGFVFVNFDEKAPPLVEYLGVIPEHFANFGLERSCTLIHVQKHIACNWKVGQEAFFESLHARTTHPQLMPFIADVDSQYDVLGEHVSRMITPSGVPSSHLEGVTEAEVLQANLANSGRMAAADISQMQLPEGVCAREYVGELIRKRFQEASGRDLSQASLSELQDAVLYTVFPNMQLWAGHSVNLVYRFIPNGNDPEHCIFDLRMLGRYPEGQPCPPAPSVQVLKEDESFTDNVKGIGALAKVLDQDMRNLPYMTAGLKSLRDGHIELANYQEVRIRHHHQTLDKYLGL
jgi:phenylpropionate dioxygenase-like ring-hydroxylating dioxygenase large terminal subunit